MSSKNGPAFDYPAYTRKMRIALSNDDFINANGDINHQYFLVKKGSFWSDKHQKALTRAIEIFGKCPIFRFFYKKYS